MKKRPTRPRLEQLEDRQCPSLTAQFFSGNLVISGTPTGTTATGGLLVQGTAAHTNNFTVLDGTRNLGTFAVSGYIMLNLTGHQNDRINVDLNGNTIPGDLTVGLGTGDNTANVINGVGVYDSTGGGTGQGTGHVGGNLQVLNGSGRETFVPGFMVNASGAPTPEGLRVNGDIVFSAKTGGTTGTADGLTVTVGDVMDTGVSLESPPVVSVGGNVSTSAVDSVGLSNNTTVGKSVYVNANGERPLSVQVFAHVTQNVSLSGSNLAGPSPAGTTGNFLDVGGFSGQTAVIGGSLSLSGGAGDDVFVVDPGTTVGGGTSVTGGAGSDTATMQGTFGGNLTIVLGDGPDAVYFDSGASVAGNMIVDLGNGNDSIGVPSANNLTTGAAFNGSVGGSLSFQLGSGNSTAVIATPPVQQLRWTSGNGNDSVTLGAPTTPAGSLWNVYFQFGSGSDTLTLSDAAPATQFITGFVDMGGPAGGNVFNQGSHWAVVQPFAVQNV